MPFIASVLPVRTQLFLAVRGVDLQQPLWAILFSMLFVPQPDPWGRTWQARLAALFPHINFRRPRLGDLIRIPLQLLWLALIRQHPLHSSEPGWRVQAWTTLQQAVRRLMRYLRARVRERFQSTRLFRRGLTLDAKHFQRWGERYANHWLWDHPVLRYAAYAISASLAFLCITTPFNTLAQIIFVTVLWSIALLVRRIPGQVATLLLVVMSVTASTRYLWRRTVYTINGDEYLDLLWGLLLLAAEFYTWLVLLLGYAQTAWPLKRQPFPLPEDSSLWPSVDIYIPTYNEPLKVVKPTVFAASGIDWPKDKLNIYILDDGLRDEFRRFA